MDQEKWYYQQNEQQIGPVSKEELTNLLIQQKLTKDSYVWTEGMENWQAIHTISDFAYLAPTTPIPLRPTSITVLGILNIVFGSLNLLCTPIAILGLMVPQPDGPFQMGPAMKIYTAFGIVLGLVCSGILLASGIGLLKLKCWARKTAYYYGWFAIVWGIIALGINAVMMIPELSGLSEHEAPAVIGGIAGGVCGGIIGFIYPVVLVIFLRKPHIIDACNR